MRRLGVVGVLCGLLILLISPAAAAVKIGVMGDSLSDEYSDNDPFGFALYADTWTKQLVNHAGVDMGPTNPSSWGLPRLRGYEYNWARAGATSGSLLSGGQHTGLAAQVGPEGIDYAVMMIGANDQIAGFPGSSAYENIGLGIWTSTDIDSWATGVANNIDTALGAIIPTGVKTLIVGVPDYGVTPLVRSLANDPPGQQVVHDAFANVLNPKIEALAQTYNLPYVDFLGALDAIFGPHTNLNTTLAIGNVDMQLLQSDTSSGTNPTAAFVDDGIHPNTTLQGMMANLVMEGLNIGYGANLTLFSEQEILAHRGIAYGGSDTLQAQFGNYSDYVVNYVPEPSSVALAMLGAALSLVVFRRQKRRAEHSSSIRRPWFRCRGGFGYP